MDLVLFFVLLCFLILQTIIIKFFCQQLSDKLSSYIKEEKSGHTFIPYTAATTTAATGASKPSVEYRLPPDKPAKNAVMEQEENEVEFDENVPIIVPPDIKFEVEGGDSQIPPQFEEKKK